MKYTIESFNSQFGTDDQCLDHVYRQKFPEGGHYKIKGRPAYADRNGKQVYPLKGTIFEKSTTPLRLWFFAIYLFSQSKHGVSAKELQRNLGVTYKTAWRIGHLIRGMMKEDSKDFHGTVECDETYIGGKRRLAVRSYYHENKTMVFGMVERGGRVHTQPIPNTLEETLIPIIKKRVPKRANIMTDEHKTYGLLRYYKKYKHRTVQHGKKQYVRKEKRTLVHTNTIEGFWGELKRGLLGTHHSVSKGYLPSYLAEATFRYNHRDEGHTFPLLIQRAALARES